MNVVGVQEEAQPDARHGPSAQQPKRARLALGRVLDRIEEAREEGVAVPRQQAILNLLERISCVAHLGCPVEWGSCAARGSRWVELQVARGPAKGHRVSPDVPPCEIVDDAVAVA